MKENNLKEVSETEFLENIIKTMEEYLQAYEQIKGVYEQYLFDKEHYRLKFYLDEKDMIYMYIKHPKQQMGFRP